MVEADLAACKKAGGARIDLTELRDIIVALEERGLRGCSKFDRDLVKTTSNSVAASTLKTAIVAEFFIVPEVLYT